jgi:hypothetical protein
MNHKTPVEKSAAIGHGPESNFSTKEAMMAKLVNLIISFTIVILIWPGLIVAQEKKWRI